MFEIDNDMTVHITRGDVAFFTVTAESNGERYKFQPDDVVRIKVMQKKNCDNVAFQKDFLVRVETEAVDIILTEDETKIGDTISKPVDYWYEIELNPYNNPQTIIGYDEDGPKIFKVYPEGRDLGTVEAEDIPLVDKELSLTSERPIQNQAVARALIGYDERVELATQRIEATATEAEQTIQANADAIVEDAKSDINAEAEVVFEKVQTASDNAEASAKRAEEAAERAEVATEIKIDTELDENSSNLVTNKAVAKGIKEVKEGYLPLTGGVTAKRSARTVFGIENTALEKTSLSYFGKGVFMGEVGVTATDGTPQPFFRDAQGNESILAKKDELSNYVPNAQDLSESILEKALTLKTGVYNYNLSGASYTGDDLPHINYGYSPATVFVRANGAARVVVLWGIKHDTAKAICINYFASGDGTWSGWFTLSTKDDLVNFATKTDLSNRLPLKNGTTNQLNFKNVDNGNGSIFKNHSEEADYGFVIRDTANDNTNALLTISAKNNKATFTDTSGTQNTVLHTGNSASVVITDDDTTPPSNTNALWVY